MRQRFLNILANKDFDAPSAGFVFSALPAFAGLALGPATIGSSRRDTIWARVWKASADLVLAPASRIIWPLLAAAPKVLASNGMIRLGCTPSAAPKSLAGISGRPGTPTWFNTRRGGASLGRP